ncbi:hypothetical protein E4634_01480 [Mangrovimicrobium sediminis]|uniref:Uncharacterized protein n=1 Tax=Mangrovimicrobium sediminis TaxID=2562682 RepID=A0A4Z0M964_9GAMM|nr:hypothetical protein [Haliea sp. SAOS-164]TGD76243.1 hypothetical protein E4634_01480 [Haliea sp. SAOS-164]
MTHAQHNQPRLTCTTGAVMQYVFACLGAVALTLAARAALASPAHTGPVIDMHLHAYTADGNGPPPTAICVGVAANLAYDPASCNGLVALTPVV